MTSVKNIKFTSPKHLSQDELVAYDQGKLTGKELHAVESHLVDCEFCSEALQGLEGMDDSMRLARITHELHARSIHKNTGRRNLFSPWQIVAIISVIVILSLLILISLYLLRGK